MIFCNEMVKGKERCLWSLNSMENVTSGGMGCSTCMQTRVSSSILKMSSTGYKHDESIHAINVQSHKFRSKL